MAAAVLIVVGIAASQYRDPVAVRELRQYPDETLPSHGLETSVGDTGNVELPLPTWRRYVSTHAMDDSPIIRLSAATSSSIYDRYGSRRNVSLVVRCQQNTTSLVIITDDYTGIDDVPVRIRIDDAEAYSRRFEVSTSREALGLWRGGDSIPVIRQMSAASMVLFSYTLPGENPTVARFDLEGFASMVEEVAATCNWSL